MRENQETMKTRTGYHGRFARCSRLTPEEAIERINNGEKFIIRFRSNGNFENKFEFDDLRQGKLFLNENDIDEVIINNVKKDSIIYKNFYYSVISAIIRNVSNADPATVFPGISKRIRRLEEEGKIHKDAIKTFMNALKKRTKYFEIYSNSNSNINIINENSVTANLNKYKGKVSLFVTNPPYISSVRYIETMKLEMYWLEYIKN